MTNRTRAAAASDLRDRRRSSDGRIRLTLFALTAIGLLLAALRLYATYDHPVWQGLARNDFIHYELAVDRWLATGSPYLPAEIAAPFEYGPGTFLHPPTSLLFFALFKVVPWPLFWAIPIATTGWIVARFRPAPWTWPILAVLLVALPIGTRLIPGSSDLWAIAAFAAGLQWGWPAAFLALKPSLAIAGLVGVRREAWWSAAILIALVSLPFGGLWLEWLRVVFNSPGTVFYSIGTIPFLAIPFVAWLGRTDRKTPTLRLPFTRPGRLVREAGGSGPRPAGQPAGARRGGPAWQGSLVPDMLLPRPVVATARRARRVLVADRRLTSRPHPSGPGSRRTEQEV